MPEENLSPEVLGLLLLTGVLFLFGLLAVALFIRQYRKEMKDREREKAAKAEKP